MEPLLRNLRMSQHFDRSLPYKGTGQINMSSPFGQLIYELCQNAQIRNVVEVGTWNGQGSTVCIMNGLSRKNSQLYSIESNPVRYREALDFWSRYDTGEKLHLIHGKLHRNPVPHYATLGLAEGDELFIHHYLPETRMIEDVTIPVVPLDDSIRDVDCILLDGGEYTTDGDFVALMKFDPKVIILDDTAIYKCRRIRAALLEDSRYVALYDNLSDRNGAAIFVAADFM